MGHIQLSRAADLVLVCPATADLMARMAAGIADDLATTLLLATDKPVVVAPAMNVRMWQHAATRRNVAQLTRRRHHRARPRRRRHGVRRISARAACPSPPTSSRGSRRCLGLGDRRGTRPPRAARRQAYPRHRRADPRADRSGAGDRQSLVGQAGLRHRRRRRARGRPGDAGCRSGLAADARAGLRGSMSRPPQQMAEAVEAALPADVAILVAAVADWKVDVGAGQAQEERRPARAQFAPNPDILATLGEHPIARACWSASPPRPTMSSPMPAPSAPPRRPTGSSPTTFRAT